MPQDPDLPPAKKFKPGSVFFRLEKNKPGMLLPRKGNVTTTIDVQRKRLPIYQARPRLLNELRQLHNAIVIGKMLPCWLYNYMSADKPVFDMQISW